MRIAVLADIHGNLQAFEAVLSDLERHGHIDALLVAGDTTGGPDQETVLQRLVELGAVMIQGNGERSITRYTTQSEAEYVYTARQFSFTRWTVEHLSPASLAMLHSLPEQRVFAAQAQGPVRIVHGSPRSVTELVYLAQPEDESHRYHATTLDQVIHLVAEPVIVFGHTHIPWMQRLSGRLALNPGALSFPANGFTGAQYAIMSSYDVAYDSARWDAALYSIPYDMDAMRRSYEASGLLDTGALAHVFLRSLLTGVDYLPHLFGRTALLAKEAGCQDLPYFPDDIWDRAGEEFMREYPLP